VVFIDIPKKPLTYRQKAASALFSSDSIYGMYQIGEV
jgi:hypothetical protein